MRRELKVQRNYLKYTQGKKETACVRETNGSSVRVLKHNPFGFLKGGGRGGAKEVLEAIKSVKFLWQLAFKRGNVSGMP